MSMQQELFQQVNYSKFFPPKTHPLYFVRKRLLERLGMVKNHKYTLLQAPEGYGKSSLLSDWYHRIKTDTQKTRTAWFRVDAYDCEPQCFWGNLIEAIGTCWPGLKTSVVDNMDLLEQSSPFQLLLSLANYIVQFSEENLQYILIFDDFESFRLSDSEGQFFLFADMLPANVNFVIASKEHLNNKLIEQDAYSKFMTLGVSDLAITRFELDDFLHSKTELDLSEDVINAIYNKTEGWPLALYLLLEQLRINVPAEVALAKLSKTDSHSCGLVFQKATHDLPQKVMMFLLETSFFERISAQLCNYVFDNNEASAILLHLERRGMFIVAVDSGHVWYRYHSMFAEWLRNQAMSLHRDQVRALNHKAAFWYRSNDNKLLSAKHIIAASEGNFISDLTKCVFIHSHLKDSKLLMQLFELKEAELEENPFFCLLATWAYVFSGKPNDTQEWLERTIGHIEKGRTDATGEKLPQPAAGEDPTIDKELKKRIELVAQVIEAKCFILEGRSKEGIEQSKYLLSKHGPFLDDRLKMVLYQNMGEAYELTGDPSNATKFFQKTMTIAQVNGYDFLVGFTRYQIIQIIFVQGKLNEAESFCRTALVDCPPDFTVYGALYSVLGLIKITQNEFEELETILRRAFDRVSPDRNIDIYLDVCVARARYLAVVKDYSEALLQMAVARQALIGNEDIPPRGRAPHVYMQHARLYLEVKDFDSAKEVLNEYEALNWPVTVEGMLKKCVVESSLAIEERKAGQETVDKLEKCAATAEQSKLVLYQIEIHILLARQYYYMEDHREAIKSLKKSIDIAKRDQIVQPFLDEGEVIRLLLAELVGSRGLSYDSDKFARRLVGAFDSSGSTQQHAKSSSSWVNEMSEEEAPPFVDHWGLTNRENEVLQLLVRGMNRKEIASELCTSQNTIKTHISHIYEKMDVHSVSELLRKMVEHEAL